MLQLFDAIVLPNIINLSGYLLSKLQVERDFGKHRRVNLEANNTLFVPLLIMIPWPKVILREICFLFLLYRGNLRH